MSTEAGLRQKLNKKIKLGFGKTKNNFKEGNKLSQSGVVSGKSYKGEYVAQRNFKSRVNGRKDRCGGQGAFDNEFYGKGRYESVNSDRKRKRIYAEQYEDVEPMDGRKAQNSKALYKQGKSGLKDHSVKMKGGVDPLRSIWVANRLKAATSETKIYRHKAEDTEEAVQVSNDKWRTKAQEADKFDDDKNGFLKKQTKSRSESSNSSSKMREEDKLEGEVKDLLKKQTKVMSDSTKHLDQSRGKFGNVSPSVSAKKRVLNKKSLAVDDSEVLKDQPKKRKRIRLDPHDTSNKRLDDGIISSESTNERNKGLEKDTGMSKNAQFRAIQPSPTILSFVEDNFLGRRRLIELKRAGYNTELSAPLDNIPFSTSSERERIEENMFRNKLTFFAAAKVSSSFPPPGLPEIAFAGRSNVGKSSLLNSLTRQWGVARTSDKPGLTQTINFFELGKLCLVDLPGYGFAYAKEEVKDAWEELVKEYVSTRVGLKRVCLLIDTKWGMKPRDHELIDLMERYQTKYQIVLTKTDLVFPVDVARRTMQIEESLKANKSVVQPVMMVSSKSGAGIRCLRTVLSKIARFAKV